MIKLVKYITETSRLLLREIQKDDYQSVREILQDMEIMYAWEHTFSDSEVSDWISENLLRYDRDGYSYWAVIEKMSNQFIGVCGLISEKAEDESHVGIGYIFHKKYWGSGYAVESARACADYAFHTLKLNEVTAQIRPDNLSSIKVAEKLGMTVRKQFIRKYRGKEIPHLLYALSMPKRI